MMRHATEIIKRQMVTEKCTWEGQARNRFSFIVDIHANKHQIRAAIVELYNVRVERVSTQIRKGRPYRTRRGVAKTGKWKKAVVHLHPEDQIELF